MKVFVETQRFNQWWFRLLMLGTLAIIAGSIAVSFSEIKDDPISFWIVICVGTLTTILLFVVTFTLKLETKIDESGIYYGFWPFQLNLKFTPWKEVEKCYVRSYDPISEYGGWGYRGISFRKKGVALNVKGNIGIQIVFKSGKKLLIGTQKEEEAKKVISIYTHKM